MKDRKVICPLDGKPCDPECPDRFHDTEEGGCVLTLAAEMGCRVLYLENVTENTYSLRDLYPEGGDTTCPHCGAADAVQHGRPTAVPRMLPARAYLAEERRDAVTLIAVFYA